MNEGKGHIRLAHLGFSEACFTELWIVPNCSLK